MILVELVPHSLDELANQTAEILRCFPQVEGFNIPDILRIPVRSYEAVSLLLDQGRMSVPHIRVKDQSTPDLIVLLTPLVNRGLAHVLLISGDTPEDRARPIFEVQVPAAIQAIKQAFPQLKVYGALDPYRSSIKTELQYVSDKLAAGADGLFSQPFFDPRLAELYLEQLRHTQVYVGISPVVSPKSLAYWTERNWVVFPPHFSLALSDNCGLAKDLMGVARTFGQSAYLMPIRVPAIAYLTGIFGNSLGCVP
ncbi:MAG: methylenetetrahydrofolate reductase [Candidatus Margulisiibacteriota bacterium]